MTSYHFNYQTHQEQLLALFKDLEKTKPLTKKKLARIVKNHPRAVGELFSKHELVQGYKALAGKHGLAPLQPRLMKWLTMKPIRTMSGVTPVTVLTKPFPCPGKCIFCPSDIRMPKSYLADEPGAQRAERNFFDPYLQTHSRLEALDAIGHHTDKVELIILGGTWSYYPEAYQIWFIKECFRAMNEFGLVDSRPDVTAHYQQMNSQLKKMKAHQISNQPAENEKSLATKKLKGDDLSSSYNQVISQVYTAPERLGGFDQYQSATWSELEIQQVKNETAASRCVGLVIETRPDNISPEEVIRIRRLGATKTQIGFQSLNDEVLSKNHRGHDVAAIRRAVKLLRQAGFKIHAHWMPNLYGSDVKRDKQDYDLMFADPDFRPDELKIYPCSLLESAELMTYFKDGRWQPYSHQELLEVLSYVLTHTPEYCRLTRVIRDIPSTNIVTGNKKTNFRQIAQQHLEKLGKEMKDIRAREIRGEEFDQTTIELKKTRYQTSSGEEIFFQFVSPRTNQPDKILAFLRLSLPSEKPFIKELENAAVIREIHVYGQAVRIGQKNTQKPQHLGFGTQLIEIAQAVAKDSGYEQLAVISAIGTREYYRKKGFRDGQLYQLMALHPTQNADE